MYWKRLAAVATLLCCTTTSAWAADREVWVTLGTDTVSEVQAALKDSGAGVEGREQNGIRVLRVHESQLVVIARVMHDRFNRCGGFVTHDTQEQANAELRSTPTSLATAVAYTIDNAAVVNSLVGGLSESTLRGTISSLASFTNRYYTSQTGVDAANWLKTEWTNIAAGRADISVQLYTHSTWAQPSVILTITGTSSPSEVVVMGGHLDSINLNNTAGVAPGADDDASGVATLTEVLRSAIAKGYKPARTVKLMAYSGEEAGLKGSKEIAAAYKTAGTNVVGALQLDMVNYRGSSWEVTIVTDNTNAAQNTFLTNLINTYTGYTWTNITCGYACSDHASWTSQGYPASIPFEALMSEYNPYIHTANDTLANSSGGTADNALKFAKIAAAYMAELAKGVVGGGGPPDTTPPTVSLTAPTGGTVSGSVTLSATASDNVGVSRVDFLVDGAVKNSDFSSPYSYAWDSTTASNGSHTVSAVAYDGAGNSTATSAVTVTVANTVFTAVYNATLKAPACASVGTACDSGTLLTGRGSMSPAETNAPNTLAGSTCADGASGTFHSDESNDRIKVSSVNGTAFGPGKQVKVEATVWAYSSYTSDKLDLYYAANANSPTWTLIGTLSPTVAGAQTLSATYTLPAGSLQAVRARFRYQGSAAACGTGSVSYDDQDDLVFAVGP
ncbi:M20/M25/M40 family metallo-hydrolase [Myxococcaceae bacterium JPH2]|nr:M20/M25/M40 family metallo-hydrolase [Myxococcaceae bacterium JPH2]